MVVSKHHLLSLRVRVTQAALTSVKMEETRHIEMSDPFPAQRFAELLVALYQTSGMSRIFNAVLDVSEQRNRRV
jgi:hypothetical protein